MISSAQLQMLCAVAQEAGKAVMTIYEQGVTVWQKDDESPLTDADLQADKAIRRGLGEHFPGVFILSEESVSAGSRNAAQFFLVDPLDGTKEFLKRNGEFTVNIALVQDGAPVAGVVLAPALRELFFAAQGLGSWYCCADGETRALRVARRVPTDPLRVIGSRSHGTDRLVDWLAALPCLHTFVAAGSSLKFCRIAQGQADIYPRFGPTSQWDTAAAQCVVELAGGAVLDLTGQPLRYGLERPVLNPNFLAIWDRAAALAMNLIG